MLEVRFSLLINIAKLIVLSDLDGDQIMGVSVFLVS